MVTAVRPVVETPDSTATSSTPEAADTTAVQPVEKTPVSTAVSTSSKPKLDHTVDFNPLDYLYPDRYVEKGDTFRNRFLDHLYVGFTTGFSQVAPKGRRAMKNGIPFGGVAGYDFNRLHGLHATLLHTNYDMKDGDGTVKQWETDIDYVFHLSDYLYGYDKRRIFRISPTLGVGYIHSVFQGQRASIFKGQAGINVGIGLGRNAKFFIEPFFSALTDQADHSGHTNVSKYDIQYGVKAGLTVNMDNTNDFYNSDVVYTRGFFYELAQGVTFYDSDDLGFFISINYPCRKLNSMTFWSFLQNDRYGLQDCRGPVVRPHRGTPPLGHGFRILLELQHHGGHRSPPLLRDTLQGQHVCRTARRIGQSSQLLPLLAASTPSV